MIDAEFLESVFRNSGMALALAGAVLGVLWAVLRRLEVRPLHPFSYFFYFQNVVAYAVAIWFAVGFDGNGALLLFIAVAAVAAVVGLRMGNERGSAESSWKVIDALSGMAPRRVFGAAALATVLLLVLFGATGVNTILSESRFEAASGVGILIRLLEAYATVAMCFSPFVKGRAGRVAVGMGVLLFAASQVLVAGSKGGVLEALLWYVFLAERNGKRVAQLKVAAGACLAMAAFGVVLAFNLQGRGIDAAGIEGRYTEMPLVLEMAIARIIANGDVYYFLLPQGVEEFVARALRYAPLQMLLQVPGGVAGALLGMDVHSNEPGRQAYLYWYPLAPMGGPTNRLDIASYFYFGPVVGCLFVGLFAFVVGWTHGAITKSREYTPKVAVLTVLYAKLLLGFLSPSISLQRLTDCVVAMGLLVLVSRVRVRWTRHVEGAA